MMESYLSGLRNRVIRTGRECFVHVFRRQVVQRISRELLISRSVEDWVDFAFDFGIPGRPEHIRNLFSLSPIQRPKEILQLLNLLASENPRRLLEIGCAGGGTLFLLARVAARNALLIGIDLPSKAGQGVSGARARLYEEAFPVPPQRIRIIRANSQCESSASRVRRTLEDQPLDVLFIDGDHRYEGVRRDFELYSPLVRPGGLVALHDILPDYSKRFGIKTAADAGDRKSVV